MNDETTILTKEQVKPEAAPTKTSTVTVETGSVESNFGGLSVRAIIALLLVLTVCVLSGFGIKVEEPLYSLSLLVAGFYYGQKK